MGVQADPGASRRVLAAGPIVSGEGAPRDTAAALRARAEAAERDGDWPAADAAYAALFDAAVRERRLPQAADALRGQARVRQQEERYDEADEFACLSLEIAERNGLRQAAARAVNTCAAIRYLQREYGEARRLFEAALERALDVGDDVLIGWTCLNLGVLANIRGDLREARTRYLEGVASFVRSGNKQNAAQVYNNLGMVCADLQEWMEAEVCFDRGIEIADRLADVPLLAALYANRAEPLLRLRNLAKARESLDRAEQLAAHVDARGTLAEVARFRGMAARAEGGLAEAEAEFERALAIARGAGMELEEAEALREVGDLRRLLGDEEGALQALQRARELFARCDAQADAERVDQMIGEPAHAAA